LERPAARVSRLLRGVDRVNEAHYFAREDNLLHVIMIQNGLEPVRIMRPDFES